MKKFMGVVMLLALALVSVFASAATEVQTATVSVAPYYPQGKSYVFNCNAPEGFTPTSYTWYYGDGSKLIKIANSNTYHTYASARWYTVTCWIYGTNNTLAKGILRVNVQ